MMRKLGCDKNNQNLPYNKQEIERPYLEKSPCGTRSKILGLHHGTSLNSLDLLCVVLANVFVCMVPKLLRSSQSWHGNGCKVISNAQNSNPCPPTQLKCFPKI